MKHQQDEWGCPTETEKVIDRLKEVDKLIRNVEASQEILIKDKEYLRMEVARLSRRINILFETQNLGV